MRENRRAERTNIKKAHTLGNCIKGLQTMKTVNGVAVTAILMSQSINKAHRILQYSVLSRSHHHCRRRRRRRYHRCKRMTERNKARVLYCVFSSTIQFNCMCCTHIWLVFILMCASAERNCLHHNFFQKKFLFARFV